MMNCGPWSFGWNRWYATAPITAHDESPISRSNAGTRLKKSHQTKKSTGRIIVPNIIAPNILSGDTSAKSFAVIHPGALRITQYRATISIPGHTRGRRSAGGVTDDGCVL